MRSLAAVLALGLGAGCVSVTWTRASRYEPPAAADLETLAPGESDLGSCLQSLGAPLWVWEAPQGRHALAWGWLEDEDLGARVSVPVVRFVSASFSFDRIDARMRGLVLFFDDDWSLVATRSGLLRDLTSESARRRPIAAPGAAEGS